MSPLMYFLAGCVVGVFVLLGMLAIASKLSGPKPEHRIGNSCRRRRHRAAWRLDDIADQYADGKISFIEASTLMRAPDVSNVIAIRILTNTHS